MNTENLEKEKALFLLSLRDAKYHLLDASGYAEKFDKELHGKLESFYVEVMKLFEKKKEEMGA